MTALVSAWAAPALVLGVSAELVARGREGLWLLLLFFVAPLLAALALSARPAAAPEAGRPRVVPAATALVAALLVSANLGLAGDVATWFGAGRSRGVLLAAGILALPLLSRRAVRAGPGLFALGLALLALPLAVMARASGADPLATWRQVASEPAFRFRADSPWVTRGRAVGNGPGWRALLFEEEHRVAPVDPGPVRVEIADRGRLEVEEWALPGGESLVLRPRDRLQVDGRRRLRFEAGKRVPGAPPSGIAWADAAPLDRRFLAARLLGPAVTLVGGAVALMVAGGARGIPRGGLALGGLALLALFGWAECWAVYTARWAPELFLDGVDPAALVELPALVVGEARGGPWLVALTLAGLAALLLAAAVGLRVGLLGDGGRRPGASALVVSGGILGAAALLALWPVEPWGLVLAALGLGASTLAPLGLVAGRGGRPRGIAWATGLGLVVFLALAELGRLEIAAGGVAEALFAYPALVAAPAAALALRLAGRRPRP